MFRQVVIHVDGAVAGGAASGVAAVARSKEGFFQGWYSLQLNPMTNNEAEYHAVLLGLALAGRLGAEIVRIVSDSEVVVRQMQGRSRVNSKRLKPLHQKAFAAVSAFRQVRFQHVRREQNCLADALAAEALSGRTVSMPPPDKTIKSRRFSWLPTISENIR